MEARRCVEFTDVELAGGTELAALVEMVATGPVEKAVTGRSNGEDGPRAGEGRGGLEAPWKGRKTDSCTGARWRCRPVAGAWTL